MMKCNFEGKVALITGGTSGIGLSTARILLESGASVALIGRQRSNGEAALERFTEYKEKVCFIQGDISKTGDCQQVIEQTVTKFGRLNIVINSAGTYMEKAISDVTEEDFDQMMNSNIKGTYFMCKYALPHLRKSGSGAIVNISSDAGINGNCLCTTYCASKGAVTVFTKALALEAIHDGVRVNCVCPGDVDTPMVERQLMHVDNKEKYLREMASIYPIGRIGKPEEIANVICFLASDNASFVNGAVWTVDGGLTAC